MDSRATLAYNDRKRVVMSFRNRSILLLVFIALIAVCVFCAAPARHFRLRIVTSIFPLQEFAAQVAGDRGDVRLLLPPGAGVHTWQPRAGDLIRLAECDLFIYNGANLEPWVGEIMKGLGSRKIPSLEASKGLDLIDGSSDEKAGESNSRDHNHGSCDPHVWLDMDLSARIVDRIEETLSRLDPEGSSVFKKNAGAYKDRLRELDGNYREGLRNCPIKTFVVAGHAAFGYLAKRYGLEQIALYGMSPDSQPTPRTLIDVVRSARGKNISVIFFESSASPDLAKSLSRELGARTLVLNPGHNLTRVEILRRVTFLDLMKDNLRNLRDGLGCL